MFSYTFNILEHVNQFTSNSYLLIIWQRRCQSWKSPGAFVMRDSGVANVLKHYINFSRS
jgi:hypothetical protein